MPSAVPQNRANDKQAQEEGEHGHGDQQGNECSPNGHRDGVRDARPHAGQAGGNRIDALVQNHRDGDHAGDEHQKREYSTDCAIGNDEGEVVWGSQCSQGPFRAREAVKVNRKECQRDP